jgi:hypothetical protein
MLIAGNTAVQGDKQDINVLFVMVESETMKILLKKKVKEMQLNIQLR